MLPLSQYGSLRIEEALKERLELSCTFSLFSRSTLASTSRVCPLPSCFDDDDGNLSRRGEGAKSAD